MFRGFTDEQRRGILMDNQNTLREKSEEREREARREADWARQQVMAIRAMEQVCFIGPLSNILGGTCAYALLLLGVCSLHILLFCFFAIDIYLFLLARVFTRLSMKRKCCRRR